MSRKYLRFEQMGVFRPMPVPQSFIDTVRHEVWVAWQFLDVIHRPNANIKMTYIIAIPPATEPVSLAEVKAGLRITYLIYK